MKEFFAPLWAFFFDKFGVFGIVLACIVPLILIALAFFVICLLIGAVGGLFGALFGSKKTGKQAGLTPEELYEKAQSIKGFGDEMKKALGYYEQAAEGGHIPAQFMAGTMYYNGSGSVSPQKERGLRWLKEAAENGHISAMYWVGKHYFEAGQEDTAQKWLTMAAENDHADAQYTLYLLYTRKKETREKKIRGRWQDDPQCLEYYRIAKQWWKLAEKNGHD